MKHEIIAFGLGTLWATAASQALAQDTVLWVKPGPPDPTADGLDWWTAYGHLQDALTSARAYLDDGAMSVVIRVGDGVMTPDGGYGAFAVDGNEDVVLDEYGNPTLGAFTPGSGNSLATFVIPAGVRIEGGYIGLFGKHAEPDEFLTMNGPFVPAILSADLDGDGSGSDLAGPLVRFEGGSATSGIDQVVIEHAGADASPAVEIGQDADVELVDVLIRECTSTAEAAGLVIEGSRRAVLRGVRFEGNIGGRGGAVRIGGDNGLVALAGSRFLNNLSIGDGGAVVVDGISETPPVISGVFIGNSSTGRGGAIATAGPAWISSAFFSGNTAGVGGAAMDLTSGMFRLEGVATLGDPFEPRPAVVLDADGVVVNSVFVGGAALSELTSSPGSVVLVDLVRSFSDRSAQLVGRSGAGSLGSLHPMSDLNLSACLGLDGIHGTGDDSLVLVAGSPLVDAGIAVSLRILDVADLDADGDLAEPWPLDAAGLPRFADTTTTINTGIGFCADPLDACDALDIGSHEGQVLTLDKRGKRDVFGGAAGEFYPAMPGPLQSIRATPPGGSINPAEAMHAYSLVVDGEGVELDLGGQSYTFGAPHSDVFWSIEPPVQIGIGATDTTIRNGSITADLGPTYICGWSYDRDIRKIPELLIDSPFGLPVSATFEQVTMNVVWDDGFRCYSPSDPGLVLIGQTSPVSLSLLNSSISGEFVTIGSVEHPARVTLQDSTIFGWDGIRVTGTVRLLHGNLDGPVNHGAGGPPTSLYVTEGSDLIGEGSTYKIENSGRIRVRPSELVDNYDAPVADRGGVFDFYGFWQAPEATLDLAIRRTPDGQVVTDSVYVNMMGGYTQFDFSGQFHVGVPDGFTTQLGERFGPLIDIPPATFEDGDRFGVFVGPLIQIDTDGVQRRGTLVPEYALEISRYPDDPNLMVYATSIHLEEPPFTESAFGLPGEAADAVIADVSGAIDGGPDGFPDLVVAIPTSSDGTGRGAVAVLLGGMGPGGFAFSPLSVLESVPGDPEAIDAPIAVEVSDFDGDGVPEIAFANRGDAAGTSSIRFLSVNSSSPTPIAPADLPPVLLDPSVVAVDLAVGDFTAEASPRPGIAVIADGEAEGFGAIIGWSTNTAAWETHTLPFVAYDPVAVSVFDLDGSESEYGSGVAVITRSDDRLRVHVNDGTAPEVWPTVELKAGSGPSGLVVGDLDEDGFPDLVVSNEAAGSLGIYRNTIPTGFRPTFTREILAPMAVQIEGPLAGRPAPASPTLAYVGLIEPTKYPDILFTATGASGERSLFALLSTADELTGLCFAEPVPIGGQPNDALTLVRAADLDGNHDGRADDLVLLVNPEAIGSEPRPSRVLLGHACAADLDRSGSLDNEDIAMFITAFLREDPAVDFSGDGVIDNGDVGRFIALFLAGC